MESSDGKAPAPQRPVSLTDATWPRFSSRFGGLWVDLTNAEEVVQGKEQLGAITPAEAAQLRDFIANGFVILEKAVADPVVDRLLDDIERAWRGEFKTVHVEYWHDGKMFVEPVAAHMRDKPHKLFDLYAASEAAREAMFAPSILRFLQLIFERPPLAFQSLNFDVGTEQPMHQDTAYVWVDSPLELAASWIALEDIRPDSGELEYYAGSHRLPDFLWQGRYKAKPFELPVSDPQHEQFLRELHTHSVARGLKRLRFHARRGDALIWHADLAHGGSRIVDRNATRKSLVTHYCPLSRKPGYFSYARHGETLACGEGAYYTHCIR